MGILEAVKLHNTANDGLHLEQLTLELTPLPARNTVEGAAETDTSTRERTPLSPHDRAEGAGTGGAAHA